MQNLRLGWPQVALILGALACLTLVLLLADEATKGTIVEWLGWGVAGVSAFLGPAIRRRVTSEIEPKAGES